MSEIPKIARARLAAAGPGAGGHPDADQLTAFLERALGAREREQVLEHLARCAECREVVAAALPPEEARMALPAAAATPAMRWFGWQSMRWAAVAATFVIAVTLMFRAYRESPRTFEDTVARRAPEVAAPAEKAKEPAKADEVQARQGTPAPASAAPAAPPASSAEVASHDYETKAAGGPSKLAEAGRAKSAPTTEVAGGFAGGRLDDTKKLAGSGAGAAGGKVVAAAPAPMATTSEVKRGPAAQQQQAGALAQQAPAAAPPAGEEAKGQLTAETESRAAADELSVQTANRNQAVALEKDADKRERKEAPARFPGVAQPALSPGMHWIITAQGSVQRSRDNDRTWKSVRLPGHIRFRTVSATGTDVWAGGEGGALYHSSDSGDTWTRVALPAELASATIVRVEFTDASHGTLWTAAGETWATADGGATWRKQ